MVSQASSRALRQETASFVRLLKKALKTTIKAHPESKDALAHAYLRVALYLIKTKDLRIAYGTHDTHGLVLYGFSDSDWGADPDSYKSTGAYIL